MPTSLSTTTRCTLHYCFVWHTSLLTSNVFGQFLVLFLIVSRAGIICSVFFITLLVLFCFSLNLVVLTYLFFLINLFDLFIIVVPVKWICAHNIRLARTEIQIKIQLIIVSFNTRSFCKYLETNVIGF